MSNLRAITLKQPWAFSLCHAGMDVINQPRPVPSELLEQSCSECEGDRYIREAEYGIGGFTEMVLDCPHCTGTGFEPLLVAIHAGAAWDKMHDNSMGLPDDHTPTHRAFIDYFPNGDMVTGYPEQHKGSRYAAMRTQPFSAIVAVATVTGSHRAINGGAGNVLCEHVPDGYLSSSCSEWGQVPPNGGDLVHHWQLSNVRVLAEPVTGVRGGPGLWTPLQEDLQRVREQL